MLKKEAWLKKLLLQKLYKKHNSILLMSSLFRVYNFFKVVIKALFLFHVILKTLVKMIKYTISPFNAPSVPS